MNCHFLTVITDLQEKSAYNKRVSSGILLIPLSPSNMPERKRFSVSADELSGEGLTAEHTDWHESINTVELRLHFSLKKENFMDTEKID